MDEDIDVSIIVEQLKEAGTDLSKQVPALLGLGDYYSRQAKKSKYGGDFTKANALFNAALVRSRATREAEEEEIIRRIVVIYREFLRTFAEDDEISGDEIRNEINSHKTFLANERQILRERVGDIDSRFSPTVNSGEVLKNRADEMQGVFKDIRDMYVRLVGMLVKECEIRLGKPPCDYAIIALGSVARIEATPFSDLEFAILHSQSATGTHMTYFRVLSHFLHMKVINLGETIIPALGIEHLNDFQSSDPSSNWYYDPATPRGISFDGAMPWASKTPLGRMETKEKPALELIRTPQKMAELQGEDVSLKEGYHLADIMSRASLLYGEKALLDEYNERVAGKLNAASSLPEGKSTQTVGFIRGITQLLVDTATYDPWYSYLGKHCTVGALFDAKKQFYRLISLLLSDLALIFDIRCTTPWEVITALQNRGIIGDSEMASIKVCLSIANEIRLKTYLANDGQKELLSPIPQYVKNTKKPDGIQPPIFRYFNEDTLVHLLSTSNGMHKRCQEFCSYYLQHGEIDVEIFRNPSTQASNHVLKGTLYFRLQNFPKALECMKAEPIGSGDYSVALNGQGIIYNEYGEYQNSLKCFEVALQVHSQNKEASTLNVISCLDNLALTLLYMGQYEAARVKFEETVKKHNEIYGNDIDTIVLSRIMQNLGLTYHELGDNDMAVETFQKVEKMHCRLKDEIPDLDVIHLNLKMASSLTDLEKHRESLKCVEKALFLSKKLFGEQDLSSVLAHIYVNSATVYEHCNLNDQALSLYQRSLELLQRVYGDIAHPGKIVSQHSSVVSAAKYDLQSTKGETVLETKTI